MPRRDDGVAAAGASSGASAELDFAVTVDPSFLSLLALGAHHAAQRLPLSAAFAAEKGW
jgi:hypothetical protein